MQENDQAEKKEAVLTAILYTNSYVGTVETSPP